MLNTPEYLDPNKMRVRKFWGAHAGGDVVVVGSGTSLAKFDFARLAGLATVALNDAVKASGLDPLYHLFVDPGIWTRYSKLALHSRTRVLCQPKARGGFIETNFCRFKTQVYQFDHVHDPTLDRAGDGLFCRSTCATAAIMFAVKAGAARVFLLGVDGYKLKDQYYWDGRAKSIEKRREMHVDDERIVQDRHENWRRDMRALRDALSAAKVPLGPWPGPGIYNLSPKSTIDAWEKVEPEAALASIRARATPPPVPAAAPPIAAVEQSLHAAIETCGGVILQTMIDELPAELVFLAAAAPDMPSEELPTFLGSIELARAVAGAYVEIGVFDAHSTAAILRELELRQRGRRFVSIDPTRRAQRAYHALVDGRTWHCSLKFFRLPGRAAADYVPEPVAWIYVDGCHCQYCTRDDVRVWLPKVAPGGVAVFHDTSEIAALEKEHCKTYGGWIPYGVRRALEESELLRDGFELVESHEEGQTRGIRVYRRRA